MPEIDFPAAVRRQSARRGVEPPATVHAAHGPEACVLGADAVIVDEFLRVPPTVEV